MKEDEGREGFSSDSDPNRSEGSGGAEEARAAAEEPKSAGEQSFWRWGGQPIGQSSIDEDKKKQALAACSAPHATLVSCLRQGFTADCSESQKAFWDCYQKHRGVRGNKIAAWFAPPSFFGGAQKSEPAAQESGENQQQP
ncbi:hypothetical protein MPTK1_6g12060 [Marchantia polymorpha subsp. ruderalis]|uniref:Uncharacterized protein n=2 Tax=Marchantia polymorpha TaxID=3197 RepID=A0AAF6BR43_MARPO|nr:hypothetical protein MARPO_0135s0030 [Marchantia polymorpha]BBN14477.1 hypothetical protein Mp_6g12060 [Marchantia polymorpha subsp. ruderalis]|eukprot:PTQ29747.1 hypothetical protein MARPO_0135s0030 [Marchantia polymorpha]